MDLSATRHTAVWSRVELPRPPSSMLSGCLALLTFCSSNCCVQVYRSCVCQCTGGRHHTVIVCWCSPPILCLRLKPLHCGFSPRVYCFFFFFFSISCLGLGRRGDDDALLVKCRCHVDSCTFSHWWRQCCLPNPVQRTLL